MDETVFQEPGFTPNAGQDGRPAAPDARAPLSENAALRAENIALRELCLANAKARQQAAQFKAELAEIHGSLAWAAVQKARRVAAILGREGTILGRCVAACKRLIKGSARLRREVRPSPSEPTPPAPDTGSAERPADPVWLRAGSEVTPVLGELCDPRPSRELKVSVIVPSYNHAPYLEERLRSVFRQTYPPHEILFLDDASSDESVEVVRRLAAESPVPFRLILNEINSGSPFRQWLKGIDLAAGELVWIAESDDTCRPELLERLVAEFLDPDVMLAYCQSAIIGPDGRQYAEDYLSCTDDLSPTRWRRRYCVPGLEEVELALSQRNTIPNASAVVFRKPLDLDERDDLETLRLGGDWLFYAMRIRRGKISYVPASLNGHRHHEGTVRNAFERAIGLFEEQLSVKARVFESFPITANALSCSMARSFVEYIDRTSDLGERPAMTEHPRLASQLGSLRAVFRERVRAPRDLRILLVVTGVGDEPGQQAMIDLANELAGRFPVFLCNALPGVMDPVDTMRIDERVVLLEGTLGILPWSWDGDPRIDPTAGEAMSGRRAEVIRELIAFHHIDVIHSRGWWADRLVVTAAPAARIPWYIDLRDGEKLLAESRRDPGASRIAGEIGSTIRGAFYRHPDDLRAFPDPSVIESGRAIRIGDAGEPPCSRGASEVGVAERDIEALVEIYLAAAGESQAFGRGPHFAGSSGRLRLQGPPRHATHDREVSFDRSS